MQADSDRATTMLPDGRRRDNVLHIPGPQCDFSDFASNQTNLLHLDCTALQ